MIRSILLSLLIVLVAYGLRSYVDSFKSDVEKEEMVNLLEGVRIKSYSKQGIEWTIKGKYMKVVDKDLFLVDAELNSEEARLKAGQAYIDRTTGKGELSQGVELVSKDLVAKSQRVFMDIGEGRFYGDGKIEVLEGQNRAEGEGFEIRLKPLQIILYKARTILE
ncbi:MAG: hypothetical protein ACK4MW_03495 [Aquificaceae bacterium]